MKFIRNQVEFCTEWTWNIPELINMKTKQYIIDGVDFQSWRDVITVRLEHTDKSSIAEHSYDRFDTAEILHRKPFCYKRIIKKTLEICKNRNNLKNDNRTYDLSNKGKTIFHAFWSFSMFLHYISLYAHHGHAFVHNFVWFS